LFGKITAISDKILGLTFVSGASKAGQRRDREIKSNLLDLCIKTDKLSLSDTLFLFTSA
jgi:hypothetical protein